MLTYFSVKNFRIFNDWTHFDLTSDKKYTFNENAVENGIIKHTMVYGENGQGKTNLGVAMCELTSHLSPNVRADLIEQGDNTNADNDSDISEFCYQFEFDQQKVKYHYGKDNTQSLVFEHLAINDDIILNWDRKANDEALINLAGTATLNRNLSENIKSIILYVDSNANLINTSVNNTFKRFVKFTQGMVYLRSINNATKYIGNKPIEYKSIQEQIIDTGVEKFQQFLADFGINCQLEVYEGLDGSIIVFVYKTRKVSFWASASSGTKELSILFCWMQRIINGDVSFAFVDEFDAFYHHSLAKKITKLTTDLNAQTILSTHNTSIMTNDILRPDCYFEIKDGQIKPLHDLTDRELRKAHSLEKLYRSGAFNE